MWICKPGQEIFLPLSRSRIKFLKFCTQCQCLILLRSHGFLEIINQECRSLYFSFGELNVTPHLFLGDNTLFFIFLDLSEDGIKESHALVFSFLEQDYFYIFNASFHLVYIPHYFYHVLLFFCLLLVSRLKQLMHEFPQPTFVIKPIYFWVVLNCNL